MKWDARCNVLMLYNGTYVRRRLPNEEEVNGHRHPLLGMGSWEWFYSTVGIPRGSIQTVSGSCALRTYVRYCKIQYMGYSFVGSKVHFDYLLSRSESSVRVLVHTYSIPGAGLYVCTV